MFEPYPKDPKTNKYRKEVKCVPGLEGWKPHMVVYRRQERLPS